NDLMTHQALRRVTSCFLALVLPMAAGGLVGCGSQENEPLVHTPGSAGKAPGDSVLRSDTERVIWKVTGRGFGPAVPAGAVCDGSGSYDVDVQTGALAWNLCRITNMGFLASEYTPVTGSRMLTAAELAQTKAAIGDVKVTDSSTCGADLAQISLEVRSTS